MNDTQMLTIALAAVPTVLTVLIGILPNNARRSDVSSRLGGFRSHMDAHFNDVDRRFDEMKEIWRAELHRVEDVLEAHGRSLAVTPS